MKERILKLFGLHWLFMLAVTGLLCLTVGCSGGDDDDGDGGSSDNPSMTEMTDGSSDGDSEDPSARPGLARIIVDCDLATSDIIVVINGDEIETRPIPESGGELFSNTVLGPVTFTAQAEGLVFNSVTVDMVRAPGADADDAQVINLTCMAP